MTASDYYMSGKTGLESPPTYLEPVTPDDDTDLVRVTRAVNVATAGFVNATTLEGTTAPVYIVAGIAFSLRATRIHATGTTATGIVGMS